MATFIVTNNADSGAGSLRQAALDANASGGADTISFDAGFFDGEAADVIRLTGGPINVSGELTIDGGAARVVITGDANGDDVVGADGITDVDASGAALLDDNSRIFEGAATLTLDGLTLTGGRTTADTSHGGAVAVNVVTLVNSTIAGNSTAGDFSRGGGIVAYVLHVENSEIRDNRTSGFAANGGGAFVFTSAEIVGSTISGNAATGYVAYGGGLYAVTATLANSTVSGNRVTGALGLGGGIAGDFAELTSTTVTGNAATGANSAAGGIFVANFELTDSIVLGNVATNVASSEIGGNATLAGGNIVGTNLFDGTDDVGDVTAADVYAETAAIAPGVLAGVLADNGGPTRTVLIRAGGAAVDAGGTTALATDQRGEARVSGDAADLGAVELQREAGGLVVTTAADVVDAFDGLTSLREAVAFADAQAGADTITFDASVFDGEAADVIRLTGGQIGIAGALTIDGGAARVVITSDAGGNDVVDARGITDVDASLAAGGMDDNGRIFAATAALTLDGLVLTGGRAFGQGGAAIGRGGAIHGTDVTLIDSEIAGNVVTAYIGSGGAVYATGTLRLTGSTVSGNAVIGAYAGGGGAFADSAILVNSTISGNRATGGDGGYGGGVLTRNSLSAQNVTVTGNSVEGDTAIGAGLLASGTLTLADSIVLGNHGADGAFGFGSTALVGGNILDGDLLDGSTDVGDVTAAAVFAQTAEIAPGVLAGVLADNGGPTRTVAILADGPAAGAADPASATAADQRGEARDAAPDLGAYEAAQPDLEKAGTIGFALLQIDTNGKAKGGAINAPAPAELNDIDPAWVRPASKGLAFRQLVALVDDDGDPGTGAAALKGFDAAMNLSDAGKAGRVTSLAVDNGGDDPVLVRGWGRIARDDAGDLTDAVRFDAGRGFGLDNARDGSTMARWLNNGDSLDFALADAEIAAARFTVAVRNADGRSATRETATLALDFDGDAIVERSGRGFDTDALVLIGVHNRETVEIDFLAEEIRVAGALVGGVGAGFWDAFAAEGSDNLTIGTRADDRVGLALSGLELDYV